MFSDFKMHVIGVPQIAPEFGVGKGNVVFDGPGQDEDFGLEQITGNAADQLQVPQLAAAQRCTAGGVLP
jgi:cytochrome c peroxidase